MRNIFFALIFITFICHAESANVIVDSQTIEENKSFDLIIETDFSTNEDALDIKPLFDDFIIGNIHSESTSNGSKWIVPIQPVKSGDIVIPSLKIGKVKTEPYHIQVASSNSSTSTQIVETNALSTDSQSNEFNEEKTDDNEFDTALEKSELYKNEIFPYTIITTDKIKPFISVPEHVKLLDENSESDDKMIFNDHFQSVHIYKYYLYSTEDKDFEIYAFNPQTNQKSSASSIKIKKSSNILASQGISIEEKWEPNSSYILPETPYVRTIKITGINNTVEQLPKLSLPSIQGVDIYADDEHSELKLENSIPIAIREFKQVFISKNGKAFKLPEIKINWWNTNSERVQTLLLPSRSFSEQPRLNNTPSKEKVISTPQKQESYLSTAHLIITCIFLSLALIIGFIFRKKITHIVQLQKLNSNFKDACQINDASQAYKALLDWANAYYLQTFTSLEQIPFSNQITIEINELEEFLFGNPLEKKQVWNGAHLYRSFMRAKK